jgi:small subunit ribosomal protein S6
MYKYEATFIFNPGVEMYQNAMTALKKEFDSLGIKVIKEEDKGEQALTYAIKKIPRGHYVFFEIEAPPQSLVSLDKTLKIKPEILKYLFVRMK